SGVDHSGLGHIGHLDHRAAGSDPELPRHWRAPADAKLGQYHLREPDLFCRGPLAGVHSRRGYSVAVVGVQSARRCAPRHSRPNPAGEVGMIGYLARRFGQAALILLGISVVTFVLLYLLPADPVRQIAGRSATAETVE